jgi:hypothetical protein
MKKNATLVQTLCLPFCRYYKPGRNEELLCRGAIVIQRLIESGRNLSIEEKPGRNAGREVQEPVIRLVCGACGFREQDCDFAQDRTPRPCGGFELISSLLMAGVITVEDIK